MDWNMVESRARSTGMCLSDRPFMDHAGVNPADKLQRLLLKSCQCCPWPMCRTSDAVGMINLASNSSGSASGVSGPILVMVMILVYLLSCA
jgi:hypothetical protein